MTREISIYWVRNLSIFGAITIALASSALASSSLIEKAKRDPGSVLESLKKVLKEENEARPTDEEAVDVQNTEVSGCNYSDEVINAYPPHRYMVGLQEAARHDFQLAEDFSKAGYPEGIWRPALAKFTRANLDILRRQLRNGGQLDFTTVKMLMRPHEKALVRTLDTYKRKSGRDLPSFSSAPYCGGDYIGFFSIRTSPPGGQLRIIREFFFQLCVAEGMDPYSGRCSMWLTPTAKAEFPQGTYRYRIQWADGAEECGKSDFQSDDAHDQIMSITLERTNKACEK